MGCEISGVVRDAFRAKGHEAWSCDIQPSPHVYHIQGDVREVAARSGWDLAIFHPPCTHLAVSGSRWFKDKGPQQEEALQLVRDLLGLKIPRIALENPISIISTRIRKPDQIIQPYQFGHDASKSTCLWLNGLLPLRPTKWVEPRIVDGKKRWANQTDSGQNRLGPSEQRAALRAVTYQGIADAMAEQWG